jgi:hypothetical protein
MKIAAPGRAYFLCASVLAVGVLGNCGPAKAPGPPDPWESLRNPASAPDPPSSPDKKKVWCFTYGREKIGQVAACVPSKQRCDDARAIFTGYGWDTTTCFPQNEPWCAPVSDFGRQQDHNPLFMCSVNKEECEKLSDNSVGWVLGPCVPGPQRQMPRVASDSAWCQKDAGVGNFHLCGPTKIACEIAGQRSQPCVETNRDSIYCLTRTLPNEKLPFWQCLPSPKECKAEYNILIKTGLVVAECTQLNRVQSW